MLCVLRRQRRADDIGGFEFAPAEGVLHFNTTRIVKLDLTNPFDLSMAEMEARKQVAELMTFFIGRCRRDDDLKRTPPILNKPLALTQKV